MKLYLRSLKIDCIIGELAHERVNKQTLEIDVELDIADKVSETDDISDTVDYARLAKDITDCLVKAECRMIERAARVAAEKCLEDEKVFAASVTVTKRGAIEGLGAALARWEARK
jgi:dihydroneopterin aldolase